MTTIIDRVQEGSLLTTDEPEDFAEALESSLEVWLVSLRNLSMNGARGAPDWLGYETRTWAIGESIRQLTSKKAKWRNSSTLIATLARIVADRRLGKGRQPYLALVARYGRSQYDELLIDSLDQREIVGHAVKPLRIAKVRGAAPKVEIILNEDLPTWIKNEARKYLKADL